MRARSGAGGSPSRPPRTCRCARARPIATSAGADSACCTCARVTPGLRDPPDDVGMIDRRRLPLLLGAAFALSLGLGGLMTRFGGFGRPAARGIPPHAARLPSLDDA